MSLSEFKAVPTPAGEWIIILIPKEASAGLPSRGIVLLEGTINEIPFKTVAEPDGRGSHWFSLDSELMQKSGASTDEPAELSVTSSSEWPEPEIPEDIAAALNSAADSYKTWDETTPMARWDWIRWIRSTNNPATRTKRINVALDKLAKGEKRPCCFNRSSCTEPSISKNGVLIVND